MGARSETLLTGTMASPDRGGDAVARLVEAVAALLVIVVGFAHSLVLKRMGARA